MCPCFLIRPMIGKDIPIPYTNIAMSLVSFTVPLLLGVAFKRKWPKKALVLSKRVNLENLVSTQKYPNCKGVPTILLCRAHHPSLHSHLVNIFTKYTKNLLQ